MRFLLGMFSAKAPGARLMALPAMGSGVKVASTCGQWRATAAWAVALLLAASAVSAQTSGLPFPAPAGRFNTDTAQLASPVRYSLVVRRPAKTQVVFPDSLYDFAPFELRSRAWFPTRQANDTTLIDSAVYELMTFSPAEQLSFALPVFYLNPGGDSVPVFAPAVALQQRIPRPAEADGDTLLPAIQTLPVAERFNWPYWVIGLSLAVGLAGIANAFLGRPLQRYFRLWVEGRRHRAFIRGFDRLVAQVRQKGADGPMERALNLWKSYIERVEDVPYTTYTTKDFAEHLPDPALTKSLQTLDRYIYGGFPPDEAPGAYAVLRRMAIRIYAQKAQALRHG